jgi:hypothetical protein
MKKLAMVVAAALPLLAVLSPASAQKLEVGKWTGTVTEPGGEAHPVTYDVALKGDTLAVTVNAGEHGSFAFSEVKLNDKTLTFWFTPGPRVDCALNRRDDGAYEGTCKDAGGEEARMVMLPPKKQ